MTMLCSTFILIMTCLSSFPWSKAERYTFYFHRPKKLLQDRTNAFFDGTLNILFRTWKQCKGFVGILGMYLDRAMLQTHIQARREVNSHIIHLYCPFIKQCKQYMAYTNFYREFGTLYIVWYYFKELVMALHV